MPWTAEVSAGMGLKYASDTTDEQWALIDPLMPARQPLGRPRETELRAVVHEVVTLGE